MTAMTAPGIRKAGVTLETKRITHKVATIENSKKESEGPTSWSIVAKSEENLLTIRPKGVVS